MKITGMKVNHMVNPAGYDFSYLHFEWTVTDTRAAAAVWEQLLIWEKAPDGGRTLVYDSGRIEPVRAGQAADAGAAGLDADFCTKAGTVYEWQVTVCADTQETAVSAPAVFETAKPGKGWSADWLLADPSMLSVCFTKDLTLKKPVARARLYICGLGLYEVSVDGVKAGEEYLMPGYHSYDLTQEYQTLDLTNSLCAGDHQLSVILGNGWYKGRFAFANGGFLNLYGDRLKLIAELHIAYADGSCAVIGTDATWKAWTSFIRGNSIYDGEVQDSRLDQVPAAYTVSSEGKELLHARTSMPITAAEEISPMAILHTPAGETVLDYGEMITGWVNVFVREKRDTRIRLQYGELLQEGNFYRENLRTAKAEFVYISDGKERWVRPHFTYYGFRYVKLEGITDVRPEDFRACRLLSRIYPQEEMQTGHAKVNRLIANIRASQKGNFLSIPTDCPQRDERMGWTGDIAIFADTACFQTDCTGFLSHFMEMMAREQKLLGGSVPLFVPRPKVDPSTPDLDFMLGQSGLGMCVWGDAGVILPWTLYEHRQDKALLARQYPAMKDWICFVQRRISENPVPHLWQNDLQLGDWLALDSGEDNPFGLTDSGLLASACYYHCLTLTKKAAAVLKLTEDEAAYVQEMDAVREAFQKEFLQEDGSLKVVETQTSYALLLCFELYRPGQEEMAVQRLKALVEKKDNHLDTGFLGTAWLCQALSAYGAHDTACRIFLQESYPGWLHEVNLGAVTVWERWNSLDEDGRVSSTGMNSMNHYAYGSIAGWMYRYLCGFSPSPGQAWTVNIRPLVCPELGSMKGSYGTPWGSYTVSWRMLADTQAEYAITVPFGGAANLTLPGHARTLLTAGTYRFTA